MFYDTDRYTVPVILRGRKRREEGRRGERGAQRTKKLKYRTVDSLLVLSMFGRGAVWCGAVWVGLIRFGMVRYVPYGVYCTRATNVCTYWHMHFISDHVTERSYKLVLFSTVFQHAFPVCVLKVSLRRILKKLNAHKSVFRSGTSLIIYLHILSAGLSLLCLSLIFHRLYRHS